MNRKAMDKGIIVAGSMIVDNLKKIDIYPGPCNLTPIRKNEMALGGLVNNCIQDLARIDPEIPLKALGIVGDDTCGNFIFEKLGKFSNIDVSALQKRGETSFTDVMYDSVRRTRAYFQFYGSNADLCIDDFDFDKVTGSIMHVGYMLLLDNLDQPHPVYGTKMGEVLHKAQSYGIKTSIDIVSEQSERFARIVRPALRHCDYCIVNEIEGSMATGAGKDDLRGICEGLLAAGVREQAVVHCPKEGVSLDRRGNFARVGSLRLPDGWIRGSVGAGDAFCAGVLYAIMKGFDAEHALRLGSCAAAMNLSVPDSVSGAKPYAETMALDSEFTRQ